VSSGSGFVKLVVKCHLFFKLIVFDASVMFLTCLFADWSWSASGT